MLFRGVRLGVRVFGASPACRCRRFSSAPAWAPALNRLAENHAAGLRKEYLLAGGDADTAVANLVNKGHLEGLQERELLELFGGQSGGDIEGGGGGGEGDDGRGSGTCGVGGGRVGRGDGAGRVDASNASNTSNGSNGSNSTPNGTPPNLSDFWRHAAKEEAAVAAPFSWIGATLARVTRVAA